MIFLAPGYHYDHYLDQAYFSDKFCANQDYNLDVFRDQVHVGHNYIGVFLQQIGVLCYLKLVKVCLNYETHLDMGNVMKREVPWDPGGSRSILAMGCTLGCTYWAWAAQKPPTE
jgi:hypothetical protein